MYGKPQEVGIKKRGCTIVLVQPPIILEYWNKLLPFQTIDVVPPIVCWFFYHFQEGTRCTFHLQYYYCEHQFAIFFHHFPILAYR